VGTRATDEGSDAGGGNDTSDDAADDDAADDDATANDDDATADDDGAADDDATAADDDGTVAGDDDTTDALVDGPLDLPETNVADLEPPEPLLPDTPPETPVSDLSEDEFEELCEPYLGEATNTVSSLDALCGLAGIGAANDSSAATVEEYQRACGEARIQCETDSAAAQVLVESLECTMPEDCMATVEQVDACYQQLYVLNAAILEPLGLTEFPPCEELTPAQGGVIAAQVLLYLLANATIAQGVTGEPVDQEGDPCEELEMVCPGLAAPAVVPM
jgi:hypothetical protein